MKRIGLILIAFLIAFSISAQGDVYLKNKASDNWFMSAAGGTNIYLGSGSSDQSFSDALGIQGQIAVGKWISPNWGGRLVVNMGQQEHYMGKIVDDYTKDSFIHPQLHVMFNMTNATVGYKAGRVYNFIPYAGFGWMMGFKNDNFNGAVNNELTWNLGFINDFRLSKITSIFIDASAYTVKEGFGYKYSNYISGDMSYDIGVQALIGLKFNLGASTFSQAKLYDGELISDLNGKINELRVENETLNKRPEFCPECPEVVIEEVVGEVFVPNVVFFRINSATIDNQQGLSVKETAEYMLANKDAKVEIVAYADRNTGNADYNMKLSERRAKAVLNALTSRYSINVSRITIDWKGDIEQPYTENDWNRVAIFIVD